MKPFYEGSESILPRPEDFADYQGFLDARIRYRRVSRLMHSLEGLRKDQVQGFDIFPGDAVIREFIGGSTVKIPHNE